MTARNLEFDEATARSGRWRKITQGLFGLGLLVLLVTLSHETRAQQEEILASGEQLFNRVCAVCHGLGGKGDGVLGEHLKTAPANLTGISTRSGGTFPFWQVYGKIDGREDVAAHGSREMPVWGASEARAESGGHLERGQILEILFYLQSIQEE